MLIFGYIFVLSNFQVNELLIINKYKTIIKICYDTVKHLIKV